MIASHSSRAIDIAPSSSRAPVLEPQFALKPGGVVVIEDRSFIVERRIKDRWQFLAVDNHEPLFKSDADLAVLLREGRFYIEGDRGGQVFAPPPISPIAVGPDAHKHNLRKHAYVGACLATGELRRSRRWLLPQIHALAAERGENVPGFSTVLSWLDEYERHGQLYGTAAYCDRHDLKGNRKERLMPYQEQAIEKGLDAWLTLRKKRLGYDIVCSEVAKYDEERGNDFDKGALGARYVDENGRLRPPSLRTFERRALSMNRMLADWGMNGPAYAKCRNLTWQTTKRPERPYAEVEVDHCKLDLMVIDESGLILGRPDLVLFRDRATAMVLGYGLGFEEPSYASFLQGLKHTMYPKKEMEELPNIKNGWPCYGRIENLYVDNGLHFVGDNIREAGRELGFNIVQLPPRQPWFKGGLERFFETLNTGLIHMLPGTTLENVLARKDQENLGEATYTLAEFEALLRYWICEIYHDSPTKALGPIRGVGGRPLSAWQEKVGHYSIAALPHADLFIALAGDVEMRTIQRDGIVWDYIKYESPDLWTLLYDPRCKRRSGGTATRFKVVRDPFDLGYIRVHVPWDNAILTIPATRGHFEYANGLTLHQHRVILANAKTKTKKAVAMSDLQRSRSALAEIALKLRQSPGRKKVLRALGRYLDGAAFRRPNMSAAAPQGDGVGQDFSDLHQVNLPLSAPTAPQPDDWRDEDDLERLRQKKKWKSHSDN